jgi:hypothetical protein
MKKIRQKIRKQVSDPDWIRLRIGNPDLDGRPQLSPKKGENEEFSRLKEFHAGLEASPGMNVLCRGIRLDPDSATA